MPNCLVSFGSNLSDRETTIRQALSLLEKIPETQSFTSSALIETAPIGGGGEQSAFLNGVVRFDCQLSAFELHKWLRQIEVLLGRKRHERWSARTLDLDLIGYGDEVIDHHELRVPHPRMSFRSFVLQPACEVAPNWIHPELGISLSELSEVLAKGRNVVQVVGSIGPLVEAELGLMGQKVPVEQLALDRHPARALHSHSTAGRARLLIDANAAGVQGRFQGGPRLRLADCPPESWRTEVRAALECVWPMCDNG